MNRLQTGFTLIELLVTMAIISILASILIPNLLNARSKGVTAAQQAQMKSASTQALVMYDVTSGDFTTLCTAGNAFAKMLDAAAASSGGIMSYNTSASQATTTLGICHSSSTGYAAEIYLKSGKYLCIDSINTRLESATPQVASSNTDVTC